MTKPRTLSHYSIAHELGHALRQRLLRACIRDLQRMPESGLAGEFSGLANVWDEICVQQQRELSFSWHAYQATIASCIEYRLEQLKPYELDALWLLTDQGDDWDTELEEDRAHYPVSCYEVAAYLEHEVLNQANDWRNERITKYLARRYEH